MNRLDGLKVQQEQAERQRDADKLSVVVAQLLQQKGVAGGLAGPRAPPSPLGGGGGTEGAVQFLVPNRTVVVLASSRVIVELAFSPGRAR